MVDVLGIVGQAVADTVPVWNLGPHNVCSIVPLFVIIAPATMENVCSHAKPVMVTVAMSSLMVAEAKQIMSTHSTNSVR